MTEPALGSLRAMSRTSQFGACRWGTFAACGHPECPVAGWLDQFGGILGLDRRERRGHVQHVVAAGHGLLPAFVAPQVGREDR
jgi:hypothetical protein